MTDKASNQLADCAVNDEEQNCNPKQLRTSNGAPVDSLTASMTAGPRGPILLQDFTLLDHMSHFDRERIPERVVHAKGAGAFGTFTLTTDFLKKHCRADLFQHVVGSQTPVAVRFSTVGGESGSADTARDPRGFAIKFYTEQGNWDLVGNNTPIFFLRDPILFPSFIHTQKRNPATHLADANMFWDFISLRPETLHQVSFLFSDRGTPNGYRHMNGYGSHTFKNVNHQGEAIYVKYHFKTDQGVANLTPAQAQRLASEEPDYAIRDLYNAIASGNYPSWTLYVQVMTYQQAEQVSFHPFDLTKVWPHSQFPLHEVGRLVLDTNPTDYFTQVEQLAFAPSHMIPGIEPSPDKMLQARLFSYPDTHRHRLGANYGSIPVNQSVNNSSNGSNSHYQRDGPMQVTDNGSGGPNYFPNSFRGPLPVESAAWHSNTITTCQVQRTDTGAEDNISQCRQFYTTVLDEAARDRLTTNIAGHLSRCTCPFIRQRAVDNFGAVHPDYGARIAQKLSSLSAEAPHKEVPAVEPQVLSPPRVVARSSSSSGGGRQSCPFGYSSKL